MGGGGRGGGTSGGGTGHEGPNGLATQIDMGGEECLSPGP